MAKSAAHGTPFIAAKAAGRVVRPPLLEAPAAVGAGVVQLLARPARGDPREIGSGGKRLTGQKAK